MMRNSLEHDKPMEMHPSEELLETVVALETRPIPPMGYTSFISFSNDNEKLLPSILHVPKLELKTLPDDACRIQQLNYSTFQKINL